MLYPLTFKPIAVPRVWGGRTLARLNKPLPPGDLPIGESWEIVDREETQSIVSAGPLQGKTLHDLIATYGTDLLGARFFTASPVTEAAPRFPLLIKILDAQQRLSLQVHPPAAIAPQLGGEPKTEMWCILETATDAHLIAGLKAGVTRDRFEQALEDQSLEGCVHRFRVKAGDAMFIPSGRLHAIDAGLLIVEIQQNSDTTYRVYDWGRVGLDGQPRELHLEEAFQSIDFEDVEPHLQQPLPRRCGHNTRETLVQCDHFTVNRLHLNEPWADRCDGSSFHILCGMEGEATLSHDPDGTETKIDRGTFVLLPACLGDYTVVPAHAATTILSIALP